MTALIILIIIAGLAVLYVLMGLVIGIFMTRIFIYPKTWSLEHARQEGLDNGEFTEEELEGYGFRDFSVESEYGYTLRGVFSPGEDPSKTIVFVHGHTWNWYGQVKYMQFYRERGFNLVTYNHRYHADSGGRDCSGGFFEKRDLRTVVDKAKELFPDTEILGLMGESLGAATVLQSLTVVDGLAFVHADCPYSDLVELFGYQLSLKHIPRIFHGLALKAGRRYIRGKQGFDLEEVSPRRALTSVDTPVLLIHGDADDYVPTSMSVDMQAARPEKTTLVLIPGAAHAKALMTDPEAYRQAVEGFLDLFPA